MRVTVDISWTTFTLADGRVTWLESVAIPTAEVALDMLERRARWLRDELAKTESVIEALEDQEAER